MRSKTPLFQRLALLLLSLAMLAITQVANAQTSDNLVRIRILPEYGEIKAGDNIWIGIEKTITPQWHTYWKNPGDSGTAPRIDWSLPPGFEIGEIRWPTPHKLPYGPLLNYGYEDRVILLQRLKVPDNFDGSAVRLRADIEVLVCKDECIPEFSSHSIVLNGTQTAAEDNSFYLQGARERLPADSKRPAFFGEENGEFLISITLDSKDLFSGVALQSMEFYPEEWGIVRNTAQPRAEIVQGTLIIRQERGERGLDALSSIKGVVSYTKLNGTRKSFEIEAKSTQTWSAMAANEAASLVRDTSFLQAAFFALLGGLVLNLMPCVFPVLSIKALSLVKISEKDPRKARLNGLAYTAGVMISFLLIAGLLIALKAAGYAIGWGFQLQNPIVVSLLAYILFIVGLNLSGYFEISGRFGNFGDKLTRGDGLFNSFFTGVLATLVATPCTAPFMGLAVGFALIQPAIVGLSIFAALAFGLALPYLVLSFIPALQKRLPKPGKWMDVFRQLLAFPMFASAAWLIWVLSVQTGPMGVLGGLLGIVMIAFGFWLLRVQPQKGKRRLLVKILAIIAFLSALGFLPAGKISAPNTQSITSEFGRAFSHERLTELLEADAPVFVEMTAAWCITCKVNHAVAINVDSTKELFQNMGIQYLVGDWTNYDAHITRYLNDYGRDGVPIYVYYGPRNRGTGQRPSPVVLPQILTPDIIRHALEDAA